MLTSFTGTPKAIVGSVKTVGKTFHAQLMIVDSQPEVSPLQSTSLAET